MNSDPNALTERVISSFEKLSSAAKNLNNVSDELGRAITAIDYILQRLNLGVPTWVKIHGGEDQYTGMEYWSRDVGYAKIGNRWGIALCTRKGDHNNPDEEEFDSWLFNDAPRWLRVEGVEKIPDLLEALGKDRPVVLGSRILGTIDPGAMSNANYLGNKLLSLFASIVFRTHVSDLCSGMWAFESERLKSLDLRANGFDLEADIFAECALRGIPILEIPIRYDRRIGEPKLRLKEGFRIALALLKKRLRSSPGPAVQKKAFWSRWFGPPGSPRRFSNDVRR